MKKITPLLVGFLFMLKVQPSIAQRTFVEFIQESDNVLFRSMQYDHGLEQLKGVRSDQVKLKNIGLLSVYVYEINSNKKKGLSTYQLEDGRIIKEITKSAIEGLKAGLSKSGIKLLQKDDLNDSDKSTYKSTLAEGTNLDDQFIEIVKSSSIDPSGGNSDFFYGFYDLYNDGDPKIGDLVYELCFSEEIDAVLTVEIITLNQGNTINFKGVNLILHRDHPELRSGGIEVSNFTLDPGYPYAIAQNKKGKLEETRFGGFRKLLERVSSKYMELTKESIKEILK